jgi:UDP:flavonoid glycosyltransferase YjiC (YdhE family)
MPQRFAPVMFELVRRLRGDLAALPGTRDHRCVRVLFTSVPSVGHLHPMMPLARAFLGRGDEVLWVTGADGCQRLVRAGIAALPAGLDEPTGKGEFDQRFPEVRDLPREQWPDFMFPRLFGRVRAPRMLEDALPVAEAWRPDLVVCDAAELAGPIVASKLGVPNLTHSFGSMLPAPRVAAASEEVAPLWAANGLDSRPFCGCYDHRYLDIYPSSLQRADMSHVNGRQLLRAEGEATAGEDEPPEWLAEQSPLPLLYLTLGTIFSSDAVLRAAIEGIRELPIRVVLTVGPDGDPASLGAQPDNVHVARYIPQQLLLPRCTAVISHAGSGTFLATLAAGLPQLCLPQAADQFVNAAAAVASGCGIALPPAAVDAEGVRDAVQRLLGGPAFRHAATRTGEEIAAMPSAPQVAETLADAYR